MQNDAEQRIAFTAARFFDYLGANLPYQCASDEFYFFPRSQKAASCLGVLDSLEPDTIREHVSVVSSLLGSLPSEDSGYLESHIDLLTTKGCMERFLWQYDEVEVWKKDPTLYTSIPVLAVDEVLSRAVDSTDRLRSDLCKLLKQVPRFLEIGAQNLEKPSEIAVQAAAEMASDAKRFFERDVAAFVAEVLQDDAEIAGLNRAACDAWQQFESALRRWDAFDSFEIGKEGFTRMLSIGLGLTDSWEEALERAEESLRSTEERIESLARRIDPQRHWVDLIHEEVPETDPELETLELYRREVRNLRGFFAEASVVSFPENERVNVLPTPTYLRSIRATASYRAPLTGSSQFTGEFHINDSEGPSELIRAHCSYLSAHETYPGHHLLDAIRLRHENPIRRQVESPLFYEGWSCYGETLLDDLGYITDPRLQLVQIQRQLWRSLRSVLDIKLQTGTIETAAAAARIEAIGFSASTARRQIRRFCLTPGYQSCYFLGMDRIVGLRERYAEDLGLLRFHDTLLGGGQIRLDLVEERLKAAVGRMNP